MAANYYSYRSIASRSDLIIADLDFTPYLECDCSYPVPHAAKYVAGASCGCVYVICESAMWQVVLRAKGPSFCEACLERDVFVLHARPIE
jgi:hypothetical protein